MPNLSENLPNVRVKLPIPATTYQIRHDVPNLREDLPNLRMKLPNPRQDVPNPREDLPNLRAKLPNPRQNVPNPRQELPNLRSQESHHVVTLPKVRRLRRLSTHMTQIPRGLRIFQTAY